MSRKIALLLLILGSVFSAASTTTFNVHLQDYSATAVHSYVVVTLKINGVCIPSTSSGTFTFLNKPFYPPQDSGDVTVSLVPNAEITCGSVPNTTWYLIEVWERGQNGAPDKKDWSGTYQIGSTFNITSAPQFNGIAPSPVTNFAIRSGNNNFVGIEDFSLASTIGIGNSDFTFAIETPALTDSGRFQHKLSYAGTFQRISCSTNAGTVAVNIEARNEATPNTAGTAVLAADLVCSSTTTTTTTFAVPAFLANVPLALTISNVTTATLVRVHVHTSK